jgi:hypothetical protein
MDSLYFQSLNKVFNKYLKWHIEWNIVIEFQILNIPCKIPDKSIRNGSEDWATSLCDKLKKRRAQPKEQSFDQLFLTSSPSTMLIILNDYVNISLIVIHFEKNQIHKFIWDDHKDPRTS